ncbi:L domain-like protein [Gonapodya prolifera JEL478]|uniref:L domain-like protein n=1 Tax=Gonapodya prolifera (strain JEL478) TaxID=1344416 RepID=A0A139AZ87_GONPJ|nr:L domain-like protein [Gonapodya prolifera JEL478]|eukprot:KXS22046.1 L domain-like protein [Gonapodya prolifera JEL478]
MTSRELTVLGVGLLAAFFPLRTFQQGGGGSSPVVIDDVVSDCTHVNTVLLSANVSPSLVFSDGRCCQYQPNDIAGVTISCRQGRVVAATFSNFRVGSLEEFRSLNALEQLMITNGSFADRSTIPTWLPSWTNLTTLQLSSNNLGGSLSFLANMTQLQQLDLSSNQIEGAIPVGFSGLTALRSLNLSGNPKLIGSIPDLSNLTNLVSFDVSNTNLTGALRLPATVMNCNIGQSGLCSSPQSPVPVSCGTPSTILGCTSPTTLPSSLSSTSSLQPAPTTNIPLIAGTIAGIAAVLAIAGIVSFFFVRNRRRHKLGSEADEDYLAREHPLAAFRPPPAAAAAAQAPLELNLHPPPSYGPVSSSKWGPLFASGSLPPNSNVLSGFKNSTRTALSTRTAVTEGPSVQIGEGNIERTVDRVTLNQIFVVAHRYVAREADELTCEVGECVHAKDMMSDGWVNVYNYDQSRTGVVPYVVLSSVYAPDVQRRVSNARMSAADRPPPPIGPRTTSRISSGAAVIDVQGIPKASDARPQSSYLTPPPPSHLAPAYVTTTTSSIAASAYVTTTTTSSIAAQSMRGSFGGQSARIGGGAEEEDD